MLGQILADGFARVRLTTSEATQLATLYAEAMAFFDAGPNVNRRHSSARLSNGYRPPGSSYNNFDPIDGVDLNDSFLYWNPEAGARIPGHERIPSFLGALEAYRAGALCRIMNTLMGELARRYDYRRRLSFAKASVVQINSYNAPSSRELLQTAHEDGTLATVIWTCGPGLEVFAHDDVVGVGVARDEVLIMPGGIMSAMTGGDIQPLYHCVRNLGLESLRRKSIMYFSCPDIDAGPIPPYVVNECNRGVDIGKLIRTATDAFGLPADFIVDH
ncbi:hypothetical protein ACW9HJ_28130 [Nocardia gipuzkoensis]